MRKQCWASFRCVRYGQPFQVLPGVELTFRDAGHILGSACVCLRLVEGDLERRLVFSGDLGQYDSPILRDPEAGLAADLVLMESTYGSRQHRDREATLAEFGEILLRARRDGGNVLIPAFAVGRSQEILYQLGTHYDEWQVADWQVFLDSPMAIEASEVYWRHSELFDEEARELHLREASMPALPNLRLCRTADESMAINRIVNGAIVIAGSGMCTGGRIVHHLKHNLSRSECDLVFTGYQAAGTLGRALVDGRDEVSIHGAVVTVKARVHTLGGFSAHGDQADLLRWYSGITGPAASVAGARRAGRVDCAARCTCPVGRAGRHRRARTATRSRHPRRNGDRLRPCAAVYSAVDVEVQRDGRATRHRQAIRDPWLESPGSERLACRGLENAARRGIHDLDVAHGCLSR